ncbi:hypothetical protein NDU88_005747 [Pleurodeles waltl]|uniref:Uncharacterized protein n=1 Tax=Pleurodeles waltl TaxID=8319 RepID=A0AAV7PJE4_PLEWA|nr:hypothetical protein NDU88_005747 [Pleurodeles waltl]
MEAKFTALKQRGFCIGTNVFNDDSSPCACLAIVDKLSTLPKVLTSVISEWKTLLQGPGMARPPVFDPTQPKSPNQTPEATPSFTTTQDDKAPLTLIAQTILSPQPDKLLNTSNTSVHVHMEPHIVLQQLPVVLQHEMETKTDASIVYVSNVASHWPKALSKRAKKRLKKARSKAAKEQLQVQEIKEHTVAFSNKISTFPILKRIDNDKKAPRKSEITPTFST